MDTIKTMEGIMLMGIAVNVRSASLYSFVHSPQQLGYKEGLVLIPVLKLRK